MPLRKPPKLKPHSFTDEQICAKAYEIWQKHPERSPEENWDAAIRVLRKQRLLQTFISLWLWTGFGEKKLWDFLQLLIVPIVLASVGLGFQEFAKQREHAQQVADKEREQAIADDKARQDTLVKYLDQMADSLKDGLRSAKPGSDKFIIAQSRTVIALQSLDRKRQHLIIQFLRVSGLSKVDAPNKLDKDGNTQLKDGDWVLLYQAQMSKANLVNSDLSGGVLIGVDLRAANLGCIPPESKRPRQCSALSDSDLSHADLSGADLNGADLTKSNLSGVNFTKSNLSGADLTKSNLRGANLSGADLTKSNLRGVDLSGANLSGADLSGANLSLVDLRGANLSGANLTKSNLRGADLSGANLFSAQIIGTDLFGAQLIGADLVSAKLIGTDLFGAHLNDADLTNADLSFTELGDAEFSRALLLRADFRKAESLIQQQLEGEKPPLLCNVALTKAIKVNSNRDCDRLPQALLNRNLRGLKTVAEAKQFVDWMRQSEW